MEVNEVLAELDRTPDWLCCSGAPFSGQVRVGLFEGLTCLADEFIPKQALQELSRMLELPVSDWDAMYATAWSVRWRRRPLCAQGPDGRVLLEVRDGVLWVQGEVLRPQRVAVDTSEDWVRRWISLEQGDATTQVLEQEDWIAQADPTYDFIMLDSETWWMQRLARDLAEEVGAEYLGLRR